MIRPTLIAAFALQVLACGETAPREPENRTIDTPPATAGPKAYGSFEASWPTLSSAEVAANAHRGAEIVLGRALPLEPFVASARSALAASDEWEGFPLGDQVLHVKYYARKNDLRITNEALTVESEADFDDSYALGERQAREVARETFEQMVKAGLVDAKHYADLEFKIGTTDFLMGTDNPSETRRVVTQYRLLANRRLNGIAFMNAGFSVGVHVSGRLSHLRFGGAIVHSQLATTPAAAEPPQGVARQGLGDGAKQLRELPLGRGTVFFGKCEGHQAKRRFQKEFPSGKADWSELRYVLPDTAQGPTLMEPLHVVSFANHYGQAVSRRQYIGYSVREPNAARVLISEPPTPNDTGDERR